MKVLIGSLGAPGPGGVPRSRRSDGREHRSRRDPSRTTPGTLGGGARGLRGSGVDAVGRAGDGANRVLGGSGGSLFDSSAVVHASELGSTAREADLRGPHLDHGRALASLAAVALAHLPSLVVWPAWREGGCSQRY